MGELRGSWIGRELNLDISDVVIETRGQYTYAESILAGFETELAKAVEQSELPALLESMPYAVHEQELFGTGPPIELKAREPTAAGVARALVDYMVEQVRRLMKDPHPASVLPVAVMFNPWLPAAGFGGPGAARGSAHGEVVEFQHVGGSSIDLGGVPSGDLPLDHPDRPVIGTCPGEREEEERRRREARAMADLRQRHEEFLRGARDFGDISAHGGRIVIDSAIDTARFVNGMLDFILTGGRSRPYDYQYYLEVANAIGTLKFADDFRKSFELAMREVNSAETPRDRAIALINLAAVASVLFAPQAAVNGPVKLPVSPPGLTVKVVPGNTPGPKAGKKKSGKGAAKPSPSLHSHPFPSKKEPKPPETKSIIPEHANWKKEKRGKGNAANIRGWAYEDHIHANYWGKENFKLGGREFDGAYGPNDRVWYDAKSGAFWDDKTPGSPAFQEFTSKAASANKLARSHNAIFEYISEGPIPEHIKKYLRKQRISYKENFR